MWCPLRGPRLCSLGTGLEQRVTYEPLREDTDHHDRSDCRGSPPDEGVTEALVEELARQGVVEIMADEGFDPVEMARAVIKAADGDVVPLKRAPTR